MTGAIIGSALIGAATSYLGAKDVAEATKEATKAQTAATKASNLLLKQQYEQTRADQAPWRTAGEKALRTIQQTPDFQFSAADFEQMKDPSYEFRMQEGVNALDRSAASRGRALSGAQGRAVTRYGQNLASQEYGNAFNRAMATYQQNLGTQQSLAGVGQTATNLTSQAGMQTAMGTRRNIMQSQAAINALNVGGAQAQAGMYANIGQTVNQAAGNYMLYNMLQQTPYSQQPGFIGPQTS
jgi:hypothetical protein